jgi:hypothetical protein
MESSLVEKKEAGVVQDKIADQVFERLFFLFDSMYPRCIGFVKSCKAPSIPEQK